jgi:hypothetical protein
VVHCSRETDDDKRPARRLEAPEGYPGDHHDHQALQALDSLIDEFEFRLRLLADAANDR